MAKDVVGSIRGVSLDGIPFRAAADGNLSRKITRWENSRIPTSGKSMRKMIKRVLSAEGLPLVTNADELGQLKSFAENLDDIPMSYTTAAGDEYKATGSIEIEDAGTEEGRTVVRLDPADDWTPFIA